MDIDYLLLLQEFRNWTDNVLSPVIMWISEFAIGFWPFAIVAMIYWVFDRKAGKRILSGYGFGSLMNGILKLTFKIPRPWIRDSRVLPYGDSKVSATGFSFPSGHSTSATALIGGPGFWLRKQNKILCVLFFVFTALVLFARNYLGVHTPEDVLVGFASTLIMMFLASKIEDWTDKNPKRDLYVMIGGLVLCVLLVIYYNCITVEPLYDQETGKLIVDPVKMVADSYVGIGFLSAYVICRYFERRYFNFDEGTSWKDRFIIGIFALIPLGFWNDYVFDILCPLNRSVARFITNAGIVVYIMIVVPFVIMKIHQLKDNLSEKNSK